MIQCVCCGQGVVEVKCPFCVSEMSFQEAAAGVSSFCLERLPGDKLQLRLDHAYYYQCQLQMFVTRRSFCDFVLWSPKELHIERIALDVAMIQQSVPVAEKFWKLCVLPELLGKCYTRKQCPKVPPSLNVPTDEEDSGRWCYCREDKGGEMIACDGKSCDITWYHLDCVGISPSSVPRGKWLCPTCHANKHKKAKTAKTHL